MLAEVLGGKLNHANAFNPLLALHLFIAYWPKQVTWLRPDMGCGGYSASSERAPSRYMVTGTHTGSREQLGELIPSTSESQTALGFNMYSVGQRAAEILALGI